MTVNTMEMIAKIILSSQDDGTETKVDIQSGALFDPDDGKYYGYVIFNEDDNTSYSCDIPRDNPKEAETDAEAFIGVVTDHLVKLSGGARARLEEVQ